MISIRKLFTKPLAKNVATDRLEEYARCLLNAEQDASYNTKMAEYYREGITRLKEQHPTA